MNPRIFMQSSFRITNKTVERAHTTTTKTTYVPILTTTKSSGLNAQTGNVISDNSFISPSYEFGTERS